MRIDLVVGVRPNFMKVAPIIHALDARIEAGAAVRYRLVHTGQHYAPRMSAEFFEQLGIPEPDVNLGVGSARPAEQAAAIMTRYGRVLHGTGADLCLVVGDATSTMASAIVASTSGVPVAHVEAGLRSGDWTMPEEINRIITDSITTFFFTTSTFANENLRRSGVPADRIFYVGNTMVDSLLANVHRLERPGLWHDLGLEASRYLVLTLHRPSNVDSRERLRRLLTTIGACADGVPIVFPAHPRIPADVLTAGGLPPNLHRVAPLPYLEFTFLVANARAVITDSGGVTEEATVLGVPCLTVRDSTERPETVTTGTSLLVGTDPARFRPFFARMLAGRWKRGAVPEKWDGKSSERIVAALEHLFSTDRTVASSSGRRARPTPGWP